MLVLRSKGSRWSLKCQIARGGYDTPVRTAGPVFAAETSVTEVPRAAGRTSGCQIGKFDLYMLPPSSLKTKLKRYRSFKELGDDPLVTESDTAKVLPPVLRLS